MHALLVLALALAADPAEASAAPSADASPTIEPLEATDGVKGLRAVFVVRGDPDAVLETLWDVRKFRSIFPDIKTLEVVSPATKNLADPRLGTATQLDVKFFVDAVFKDATYTLRRRLDRVKRSVTWHSIAGDVAVARGSWSVDPLSGGGVTPGPPVSRVTYTSFVDVGYFVPTGMIRDVALGKVAEMAKRVRAACATTKPAAP